MNTVNNKRKKESQEKIERIFLELIQTKDIEDITVSDICKKANLNRTTFYSNYLDIYDLADKIRIRLENEVFSLFQNTKENMYVILDFSTLFNHIKDNQIFYRTYFKLGFDSSSFFDDTDFEKGYLIAAEKFNLTNVDYHIEFFKAGFNAIVKKWLNDGCQEKVETLCKILEDEYNKSSFFSIK